MPVRFRKSAGAELIYAAGSCGLYSAPLRSGDHIHGTHLEPDSDELFRKYQLSTKISHALCIGPTFANWNEGKAAFSLSFPRY